MYISKKKTTEYGDRNSRNKSMSFEEAVGLEGDLAYDSKARPPLQKDDRGDGPDNGHFTRVLIGSKRATATPQQPCASVPRTAVAGQEIA